MLELRVHSPHPHPRTRSRFVIEVPDDALTSVAVDELPRGWDKLPAGPASKREALTISARVRLRYILYCRSYLPGELPRGVREQESTPGRLAYDTSEHRGTHDK